MRVHIAQLIADRVCTFSNLDWSWCHSEKRAASFPNKAGCVTLKFKYRWVFGKNIIANGRFHHSPEHGFCWGYGITLKSMICMCCVLFFIGNSCKTKRDVKVHTRRDGYKLRVCEVHKIQLPVATCGYMIRKFYIQHSDWARFYLTASSGQWMLYWTIQNGIHLIAAVRVKCGVNTIVFGAPNWLFTDALSPATNTPPVEICRFGGHNPENVQ